ncbi:MAG TPA: acyl carrier protein [Candidatus Hydrogenedentes bacterium]|nr:acyl carrier protein [Candidatus Hydrogenedentota bacterium]
MATDVNVADTVRRIIVEKFELQPEEVTENARFVDDLGADSLDITEVIMALEEEFNIDIDDDANQIETVGDAIRYIEGKMRA